VKGRSDELVCCGVVRQLALWLSAFAPQQAKDCSHQLLHVLRLHSHPLPQLRLPPRCRKHRLLARVTVAEHCRMRWKAVQSSQVAESVFPPVASECHSHRATDALERPVSTLRSHRQLLQLQQMH
jgi:hypothetical protein